MKKYNVLYLKSLKNVFCLKINIIDGIFVNWFFNVNFNLHHLIIKFHMTHKTNFTPDLDWLSIDSILGDHIIELEFTTHYANFIKCIKLFKYIVNRDIINFKNNYRRIEQLDKQKKFVTYAKQLSPMFRRTSLSQVNRTFNQQNLLAQKALMTQPIAYKSIKDLYDKLKILCFWNFEINYGLVDNS